MAPQSKDRASSESRYRSFLLAATAVLAFFGSAAHAAIPASERQALLEFYQATRGDQWKLKRGWNGAAGTECDWYGIDCDRRQTHVVKIDLAGNKLRGFLPASLTNLTRLQTFLVDGNRLSGPLPPLGALQNLQRFTAEAVPGVGDMRLSGSIPPLPPSIAYFYVTGNQLTGEIPSLSGLANLREFDASENKLSGSIPALQGQGLDSLSFFLVGDNQLTGTIPSIQGVGFLAFFDVSNNQLTGSVPALQGAQYLRSFNAAGNLLSGGIPALDGLPTFQYLNLSKNQLTGVLQLPSSLVWLEGVDVTDNLLTGPLPSLSSFDRLTSFRAGSNAFSGSIPPGIDASTLFSEFDVSDNALTGTIPPLSASTTLFNVSNNQLTGPPPVAPQKLKDGLSSLCPNHLDPIASTEWDQATGVTPWYLECTAPPIARRRAR